MNFALSLKTLALLAFVAASTLAIVQFDATAPLLGLAQQTTLVGTAPTMTN